MQPNEQKEKCDFSCWVIRYDQVSIFGKTYRKDSLKDNDKKIVPLLWDHNHIDPDSILGYALLENRAEGVYTYCTLNNVERRETAINLLKVPGTVSLSPYVTNVKYDKNFVVHGIIREVSLTPERLDPDELYYPVLNKEVIDD